MVKFYLENEQLFARIQLILFMMGMGMTLPLADFFQIVRRPRSLLVGLFGQLVTASLIAYLIIVIFSLEAGIAMGLFLIAVLPGGNLSKVFTYIGRGNIALSITMSATATLLCIATIPVVLHVLAANTLPPDLELPMDSIIINELLLFLLAPLAAGMILARFIQNRSDLVAKWLIRAGLAIAVFMVSCSLFAGRINPAHYGWKVPLAIIIFTVVTQQLSMLPFRLKRWPNPDTVSVGIETTMRNINLILLLYPLLFPGEASNSLVGGGVYFVMLYFAGTAFFVAIPLAARMRRVIRREQLRATAPNSAPAKPKPTVSLNVSSLPERTMP